MSDEAQGGLGGTSARTTRDTRLVERAMRERWVISESLRRSLMVRLGQIVEEKSGAGSREVISAAKTILAASKINLENVSAIIKAEKHADLEPRMDEIEQELQARGWQGNPRKRRD